MSDGIITLPWRFERAPPRFEGNDIRHPEAAIRLLLRRYTKRGAKVFDPFTGLGTTLFEAEKSGRIPYGVEADQARYEWVAGQMTHWQNLHHSDTLRLDRLKLPKMDAVITCPPFMQRIDRWNPLAAGNPAKAGYETYLHMMGRAFGQISTVMKRGATAIVLLENIRSREFTPLVSDVGQVIAKHMTQTDELIIQWKNAPPEHAVTHALGFRMS